MARRSSKTHPLTRSETMSRIRATNTKPEVAVRRALHAQGFRFRLHRRDLAGKPDIVMPKHGLVIFVHGCFWHQHGGCRLASWPKTNQTYWEPKLTRNAERDSINAAALRETGWRVEVIWECETRSSARLAERLGALLPKSGRT